MKTLSHFKLAIALTVLAVLVLLGSGTQSALAATQGTVHIDLLTDIADGVTPMQDVFIERNDLSAGQVIRFRPDDAKDPANLAKMLYASSQEAPEDLFQLTDHPLGPFPKGNALGFTMQQWLAAKGSGTYSVTGDVATLDLSFQNLVPNALYTMWCVRMIPPPDPNPREVEMLPCGLSDGSQNTFRTDAAGNATYHLTTKPLAETTDQIVTAIGAAYHSDGKTCGTSPCEFGHTVHVQLSNVIPALAPAALPTAGAAEQTVMGLWLGVVVGVLLIVGGWLVLDKGKRSL